jgi:hypothetical protein
MQSGIKSIHEISQMLDKNLGYSICFKIHLANNAEHCPAAVNVMPLLCPYF